jgi:hypothetical protein
MKEQMLNEVVARRFLLGQLSPDEQGSIEELAFDDPKSFEVLQAAEDDLIDEFVYDDLSSEERERFQEYYLAQPGRREDVRIASALREYFEREQPVPSLWDGLRRWLHVGATPLIPIAAKAAAIIAAVVIGLVALIPRIIGPGVNPVPQIAQQQPTPLPSPASTASETPPQPSLSPSPTRPAQNKPPRHSTPPVYAFQLVPVASTRSSQDITEVSLASLASRPARFELAIRENASYPTFQATLEQDGIQIQTWSNLKPARIHGLGRSIRIRVPFNLLEESKPYHFLLKGVAANGALEHVDRYLFRVTK